MPKKNNLTLTSPQQEAFDMLVEFIRSKKEKVFILKGYAGTGKTTLVKYLIEELSKRNERFKLMASTGRAAKILSNITQNKAYTVHSTIYTFRDLNQDIESMLENPNKIKSESKQLLLQFERVDADNQDYESYYYIIDESSMISDKPEQIVTQAEFGSGKLLSDLLEYDSKGKFIFVGDECQLPPINSKSSPALSIKYFKDNFHIDAKEYSLTEIVRQTNDNDIILASQKLRKLYYAPPIVKWGKFPLKHYKSIQIYSSQFDMLNKYITKIKKNGYNSTTLITQSNKQCVILTNLIRPALGFTETTIEVGDLLLVTQNNLISGLMNGDMVKIVQIGTREKRAGLTFVKVEVEELYTERRLTQLMIENIIYLSETNLNQDSQRELLIDFYYRMKKENIKQKSEIFKEKMRTDIYLNALRCVFGVAITCHKAQGGEWDDVFLDIPKRLSYNTGQTEYQWLYTAVTRAKKKLHIVDDFYLT